MRRKDREIDRDAAMKLLESAKYGTLCLSHAASGYPCAVPINCAVVDGALVFHGAAIGEKHDVIARDARATFVAVLSYDGDEPALTARYESVIAKGRIEVVEGETERLRLLVALSAKVFDMPEAHFTRRAADGIGRTRMLRMSIDELTGKRNPKP